MSKNRNENFKSNFKYLDKCPSNRFKAICAEKNGVLIYFNIYMLNDFNAVFTLTEPVIND